MALAAEQRQDAEDEKLMLEVDKLKAEEARFNKMVRLDILRLGILFFGSIAALTAGLTALLNYLGK